MIIWNFLTVKNSDNTAKIIADQGEIGSFKVTNTTTLQTINYTSGTTPTASFYNAIINNVLKFANSSDVTSGQINYPTWSESQVISYKNCDFGYRIGIKHLVSGHHWYLEMGPGIHGWTGGSSLFQRIRAYDDTDANILLDGISFVLGTAADTAGCLEIKRWSGTGYAGLKASTIVADTKVEAPTFNATSDRRLKTNIQPWQPTNSILNLPIYSFDFISDRSHHIGCLAQDLQQICPEIVHEDSNGYLQIEESKIVYLLLQEVKQLKQEIELLKNRYEY